MFTPPMHELHSEEMIDHPGIPVTLQYSQDNVLIDEGFVLQDDNTTQRHKSINTWWHPTHAASISTDRDLGMAHELSEGLLDGANMKYPAVAKLYLLLCKLPMCSVTCNLLLVGADLGCNCVAIASHLCRPLLAAARGAGAGEGGTGEGEKEGGCLLW